MQPFTLRPGHLFAAVGAIGAVALMWLAPWLAAARGETPVAQQSSNLAMNCVPGQRALVRQAVVNGGLNVTIDCADNAVAVVAPAVAAPATVSPSTQIAAVYQAPSPVRVVPVRRATATRTVVRRAAPRHDWGKDALVIGGSAGAGAGIGGLISGKKGALIGAAIGGGGAALYRAIGH